jgi:decaprenylphospho-beta-D-ribofuranose 2-oxidase
VIDFESTSMPPREAPRLSGWGRIPVPAREILSEDLRRLTENAVLSRGLGRSYGDSSLPPPSRLEVASTVLADRILDFDEATGVLRAEAGLSLRDLLRVFLRRNWFPPVSPGTEFVTLGGMVAADVHGKNHHVAGTFGAHVEEMLLRVADGRILRCSPVAEPELFWATVGGMGLTGHILEVGFRMKRIPSPWIFEERERFGNVGALIEALRKAAKEWPLTVGWIDGIARGRSLGRGILSRGRWAQPGEAPATPPPPLSRFRVPFDFPNWALNKWSIHAFNALIYHGHAWTRPRVVHPEIFWYPLDRILEWNRIYGPRGFTQYQCVLPDSAGPSAAHRFLEILIGAGGADSFLCVIKDCGPEGQGMLSFPRAGISIALDLAVHAGTQRIVDRLNEAVIAEGGRIYLAKDSFTRAEHFRAMEPRLEHWRAVRRRWDPEARIRSAQSVRVFGDPS